MLVAQDSGVSPLGADLIEGLVTQSAIEKKRGILNNCFDIGRRALTACNASGLLEGQGTSSLIGWSNHWINWVEVENDAVLAFDLTASSNIDNRVGNLDVFAIHTADLDRLIDVTAAMYGCNWKVDEHFSPTPL